MNILYSIPVYENPDCVKQMCDGILFFDKDAIIILHVSKFSSISNFKHLENDKILININQFETKWGWDFTRVHVSNYVYAKKRYNFTHIILLTSNTLMIKKPHEFMKKADVGFSEQQNGPTKLTPPELIKDYQIGWGGSFLKDKRYLNILNNLKSDKMYGCIIDGTYVTDDIMSQIQFYYEKYFNYEPNYFYLEEILIPTIACNLAKKVNDSLLYLQELDNVEDYERLEKDNFTFFNKRVPLDMNNVIRKHYNNIIYDNFDYFEGIYYINLDNRQDRRKQFEKQIKKYRIDVKRFSAITPKEGEYYKGEGDQYDERRKYKIGCTLSHQAVIREAKEKGLKNVLIFEDDCLFVEDFKLKAYKYIEQLKNVNWDLFYFGGDPAGEFEYITDNLLKSVHGGLYATHAYAINETIYDRILNCDAHQTQSIDTIYVNQQVHNTNIIICDEILAFQSKSFSDLWGHVTDSSDLYESIWKLKTKK